MTLSRGRVDARRVQSAWKSRTSLSVAYWTRHNHPWMRQKMSSKLIRTSNSMSKTTDTSSTPSLKDLMLSTGIRCDTPAKNAAPQNSTPAGAAADGNDNASVVVKNRNPSEEDPGQGHHRTRTRGQRSSRGGIVRLTWEAQEAVALLPPFSSSSDFWDLHVGLFLYHGVTNDNGVQCTVMFVKGFAVDHFRDVVRCRHSLDHAVLQ